MRLREATDELNGRPGHAGHGLRGGQRACGSYTLTYAWRYHPTFADWALRGPLIELSRQVFAGGAVADPFLRPDLAREAGADQDHAVPPGPAL